MKATYILIIALLATCFSSEAKDKMKITFNDTKTVSYDVESIADITFTESGDDPVTPPAPSDKVLVTRINDALYTYDAQGRCTAMMLEDDLFIEFNYETMTLKMMGYTVGTFSLTPKGYFSTIIMDFMGTKSELKMEYNSDGYLTNANELTSEGYYYKYENDITLVWENNLLVKVIGHEIETEDGDTDDWSDVLTISYSQQENKTNQWTLAMLEDLGLGEQTISGMYGKAPARLPNSTHWDYETTHNVSYTLNNDGSINTETIGDDVYRYFYSSRPASPVKKNFKGFMRRLSRKIAEQ